MPVCMVGQNHQNLTYTGLLLLLGPTANKDFVNIKNGFHLTFLIAFM